MFWAFASAATSTTTPVSGAVGAVDCKGTQDFWFEGLVLGILDSGFEVSDSKV